MGILIWTFLTWITDNTFCSSSSLPPSSAFVMPPALEPASSALQAMLQMWNHRIRQATLDDAHRWQRHFVSAIRGDTLSAEELARGDIAGNVVDELPRPRSRRRDSCCS
ncbi:hypothetical protein BDZ89DRAFT_351347 [Hymenopellis radicata]|nr:hypothetical protein BDZ89DRAFT_351347 [Hymenopellis radicata]